MTKAELRKIYTDRRKALSGEEYARLNESLLQQFKQLDLSAIRYMHIFLPIVLRREPDTLLITDYVKAYHHHVELVYPRCNFADCSMQSYIDDSDLQLSVTGYGITEPVAGNTISPDEIDMIILPLLAFDERGYRIGYGKGFYDRFITRCRPDVKLVGLSFFDPVYRIVDTDQHDQKLQLCITPGKIWAF